jgi:hypothetical protein
MALMTQKKGLDNVHRRRTRCPALPEEAIPLEHVTGKIRQDKKCIGRDREPVLCEVSFPINNSADVSADCGGCFFVTKGGR